MSKKVVLEIKDDEVWMDDLLEKMGLETPAGVCDVAITLLTWAVGKRLDGEVIGSIDEVRGMYTEIVIPGLSDVKPRERDYSHDRV